MKYQTHYLRAETYEDFFTACADAELVLDGEIITSSHSHSLILIGTLYKPTGVTLQDSDGNDYPEMVALPGYHANLRCIEPVGLEHLAITTDNILVEWA